MSRLDTLLALNPLDYVLPTSLGSYILARKSNHSWPTTTIAPSTHRVTKPLYDNNSSNNGSMEGAFPSLPPLRFGHPDIHIRNGIMNSLRMSAEQVPDAEKAFFVADLSQVYQQHKRWKICLPDITPFYGRSCFSSEPLSLIFAPY
jgi:ornithine decarboxylase